MTRKTSIFAASLLAATFFMSQNFAAAQSPAPSAVPSPAQAIAQFGPSNPFYATPAPPFYAPPFDRIRDSDYQPAIEAGMAEQEKEILVIADNPAPPTFDNTFVAMEKSGQLLNRVLSVFNAVTSADTNPYLENVQTEEAPRLSAHQDSIYLNAKLFARVRAVYDERAGLHLDPESERLARIVYDEFVHAGAALSPADRAKLKQLNEEESKLEDAFSRGLLADTKNAAFVTTDRAALAGLSDAQIAAAAETAKARHVSGYVIPLQNTTQQPVLAELSDRATREAIFEKSWTRAEQPEGDLRPVVARLAKVRAEKAQILGYPSFAAWQLEDQMARTPATVLHFLNQLIPPATAKARAEAKEIQAVIDAQHGGFRLEPWDWEFYAEQVRKAKYDLDESQVKPYFEINSILENGVFYAAHQLYGLTFRERRDLPVWNPDVRAFEVFDANGKPLALFYCDYFKRDNKAGGAWMDTFQDQSRLLGHLAVVYNVANFPKPAPGEPALISPEDATTMFHEFGHALHAMLSNVEYPTLSGTNVPRDFVEFPSQFNEHWALYPQVLEHYARNYRTGEPIPAALAKKIRRAQAFDQGYSLTELLAASMLDMHWHMLPANAPLRNVDQFENTSLVESHLALRDVPPRYRSTYFLHIWANGYDAGYYAYQWTEMLDDDAFQWFLQHGGLTRANGDRFRRMILSRGNTEDLAKMYAAWRGRPPEIGAMLQDRDLTQP
ncbi:MAG TPA: M3 family metallopeptidase [Acidobacteriaceae bacterium]|nr:M3 family metallopeptidase [Acidobacteriaceae bacterium]